MFRKSANELFEYINSSDVNKVIIDFNNVRTITRAFAHQYLTNKRNSSKVIIDINIAPNIQKMFDIVERSRKKIIDNKRAKTKINSL